MEFYRQTTEYTTAASSLLMVVHHYNPDFKLSRENEFMIWLSTVNLPTRASSVFGLATFAKRMGVPVRLIMEEMEYDYPDYRFKGYTKKEVDEAKFMSKQHAKVARESGVHMENRDIDVKEIKGLLHDGKILMLRVNAGVFRVTGSTAKYLVFYKMVGEDKFTVLDPVKGVLTIDEIQLEESLQTLHTKKKRDHRMIVFG